MGQKAHSYITVRYSKSKENYPQRSHPVRPEADNMPTRIIGTNNRLTRSPRNTLEPQQQQQHQLSQRDNLHGNFRKR